MKKIKKWAALFAISLCMLTNLTGCVKLRQEETLAQVQGNLDSIYLGKVTDEYMRIVEASEEEIMRDYEAGLEVEADYFANYWYIVDSEYGEAYSDLDDDLKEDIIELLKDIYSHSKYQLVSATPQDLTSYAVKLYVSPIDIMERAVAVLEDESYEPLNAFHEKYSTEYVESMTDEEYWDYTNEYGKIIVQLVRDQLPDLGYKEEKSQSMQVELIGNYWIINDDDFSTFDSYVIYYP